MGLEIKKNIDVILWDFDGVILDSNQTRDLGFEQVLKDYPKNEVDKLMIFHRKNGGLSRYVKFRYFFEEIRGEEVSEKEIKKWAAKFSEIMLGLLIDQNLLIDENLAFIKKYFKYYQMHIVSGSDQAELREICSQLAIDKYFKSIQGSPTPKNLLISDLLKTYKIDNKECILIGDSVNDYEAAKDNDIEFLYYHLQS